MAGKYEGPEGKKMLIHLVLKLSAVLQPSIIFIDGAEKTFYKKVPAEDRPFKPKAVAGLLKGISKKLKPENRVMFIASSTRPWLAKAKPMKKIFPKILLFPRMDYGSCYAFWRHELMNVHGVER